jgi:hypothetical protein
MEPLLGSPQQRIGGVRFRAQALLDSAWARCSRMPSLGSWPSRRTTDATPDLAACSFGEHARQGTPELRPALGAVRSWSLVTYHPPVGSMFAMPSLRAKSSCVWPTPPWASRCSRRRLRMYTESPMAGSPASPHKGARTPTQIGRPTLWAIAAPRRHNMRQQEINP